MKLPFLDLRDELNVETLKGEIIPSIAGTLMSIPQGIAYALIAGLPPAMGLYAAALPAIVGSLLRSSRNVIVGPTNAISLVLATSAVSQMENPVLAAATLALIVGVFQMAAGFLRLGGLVDYISTSVVSGYITGAATLILVGQLPNVTGTSISKGHIFGRLAHWIGTLPEADPLSIGLAIGTIVVIYGLRRVLPRGMPALVAMGASIAATWWFDLKVAKVGDIAPIPAGLPPFVVPPLHDLMSLVPIAIAAMVLSLVESSSVARALAAKSGQRVDQAQDFIGLGAANVAAALFGGYPVSGSLARSALNFSLGARTRMSGMMSGLWVLLVPLGFGPLIDWTPISTLAGTILIVAVDLIDPANIRTLLKAGPGDRFAFAGTVLGTWVLPLDQAIYLGVGISIVLFLRRVRLLVIRELQVDDDLLLREVETDEPPPGVRQCGAIRILHIEGPLFFGAASELEAALNERTDDPRVQVLIVRVKRAQGIDVTSGAVLKRAHANMEAQGRHLMLVGMREDMMQRLEDIGVAEEFGPQDLLPTEPGWFVAMNHAVERAMTLVDKDRCHLCQGECPLADYIQHRAQAPRGPTTDQTARPDPIASAVID
ncbi:MAG: SulP family inorganic anion transporter [Alphaproteobacteria bacterium]|nr:SulP family inorganic anion transporter [Alphaproteobacteria bacterium]MCB9697924.1 SulP family inorganic anion transporter [Alphaproteobacteria bacterium]